MFLLRPAYPAESDAVLGFYRTIADQCEEGTFRPECLIEPIDPDFLLRSIRDGRLLAGFWNDRMVGALVANHEPHPEFAEVRWGVDASPDRVLVIHCFAVLKECRGLGIGKMMLGALADMAGKAGMRAIRYDVAKSDIPLQHTVCLGGYAFRRTVLRAIPPRRKLLFGMYELVL